MASPVNGAVRRGSPVAAGGATTSSPAALGRHASAKVPAAAVIATDDGGARAGVDRHPGAGHRRAGRVEHLAADRDAGVDGERAVGRAPRGALGRGQAVGQRHDQRVVAAGRERGALGAAGGRDHLDGGVGGGHRGQPHVGRHAGAGAVLDHDRHVDAGVDRQHAGGEVGAARHVDDALLHRHAGLARRAEAQPDRVAAGAAVAHVQVAGPGRAAEGIAGDVERDLVDPGLVGGELDVAIVGGARRGRDGDAAAADAPRVAQHAGGVGDGAARDDRLRRHRVGRSELHRDLAARPHALGAAAERRGGQRQPDREHRGAAHRASTSQVRRCTQLAGASTAHDG
jgi:hypothetical protein